MPPIKTYNIRKKATTTKNNPIIHRKNAGKHKQKIEPLVTKSLEKAFLSCDSLEVCTENTFDKLIRSYREKCNKQDDDRVENESSSQEISEVISKKEINFKLNDKQNGFYISTPNVLSHNNVVDNSIRSSILSPITTYRYTRNGIRGKLIHQFEDVKCKKLDSQSIVVIEDSELSIDLMKSRKFIDSELQNKCEKLISSKSESSKQSTESINTNHMDVDESISNSKLIKSLSHLSINETPSLQSSFSHESTKNHSKIEKNNEFSVDFSRIDVDESKTNKYSISKDIFSSVEESKDLFSTNESIKNENKSRNSKTNSNNAILINNSKESIDDITHSDFKETKSSKTSLKNSRKSDSTHSYSLRSKSSINSDESKKSLKLQSGLLESTSNSLNSENSTSSSLNSTKSSQYSLRSKSKLIHSSNSSVLSCNEMEKNEESYKTNEESNLVDVNLKEMVVNVTNLDVQPLILKSMEKSELDKTDEATSLMDTSLKEAVVNLTLLDVKPLILNSMKKSEEPDKTDEEANLMDMSFKEAIVNLTMLDVKPLILKPGKQWRRSLVNQTRGANQCMRVPTFTIIDEGLDESSCVVEISPEKSIRIEDQEDFEEIFQRTVNLEDDENKENYDGNRGEFGKEKSVRKSFAQERKSCIGFRKDLTAKEIVLKKCGQTEVLDFQECYPESSLKNCHKLGEGLYGEVFLLKKSPVEVSVLKIIPIEGSYPVNGEPQKKFAEILSEIIIQSELSSLRDNNEKNRTATFSRLKRISCVRGRYPDRLTELWELFEEVNGTENDHPMIFDDNQIFIILELENSGRDLENFVFYNAKQSWSIFKQIVCGLAVAENSLEFEHRDLHWGNVLVLSKEPKECEKYALDGKEILIENSGVKATIIDYTMSRIKKNGICMFNDLKNDPDLFKGEGDYQFDIYRLMKNSNANNWDKFNSYSNVLWLHYVLGKMIKGVHYRSEKTRVHFNWINAMKELHKVILNYKSVQEMVNYVINF